MAVPLKCPQCGHVNSPDAARCISCLHARVSPQLRLTCPASGRFLETTQTLLVGASLLKRRLGEDGRFASEPQFELRRDTGEGAWMLVPCAGATHPTCLGGRRLAAGAATPLKAGDVVEIGPGKLPMRVELEGI